MSDDSTPQQLTKVFQYSGSSKSKPYIFETIFEREVDLSTYQNMAHRIANEINIPILSQKNNLTLEIAVANESDHRALYAALQPAMRSHITDRQNWIIGLEKAYEVATSDHDY